MGRNPHGWRLVSERRPLTGSLYRDGVAWRCSRTGAFRSGTLNLLIRLCFDEGAHKYVSFIALQHEIWELAGKRFNWRTFRSALLYLSRTEFVRSTRRATMAWKTPKIVEVPVGMEINMYACAARK
jgi:coenzyme PQQ precursor peptide PqqA